LRWRPSFAGWARTRATSGDRAALRDLALDGDALGRAPLSRWSRVLVDRTTRPKRVRRPTTPSAVVIRIRDLCEQYPRLGREKLRILLEREGLFISAKTIDRTLAPLRARRELREPKVVRKAHELPPRTLSRIRRPSELVIDRPGYLQIETPRS
jgi:hypothetical protein